MLLVKLVAAVMMTLLLVATGFALVSFYLRNPCLLQSARLSLASTSHTAQLFPHFIAHELPPALAGGVVAALFAAAMSTISSGVNSMAAVFTIDFWRARRQEATDPEQVRLGLWFTAVSGVLITAVAWGLTRLPGEY